MRSAIIIKALETSRDALTGLKNRRAFDEALRGEFDRARRYAVPLSLAVIDLDHFKRLNDTHGHAGGDEVLRRFAEIAYSSLRSTDSAYRYGGEEFVLLFLHTDASGAREAVERLRLELDRTPVAFGGAHIQASCSGGVAGLCAADAGPGDLLPRADAALYAAKESRRNRTHAADARGEPRSQAQWRAAV